MKLLSWFTMPVSTKAKANAAPVWLPLDAQRLASSFEQLLAQMSVATRNHHFGVTKSQTSPILVSDTPRPQIPPFTGGRLASSAPVETRTRPTMSQGSLILKPVLVPHLSTPPRPITNTALASAPRGLPFLSESAPRRIVWQGLARLPVIPAATGDGLAQETNNREAQLTKGLPSTAPELGFGEVVQVEIVSSEDRYTLNAPTLNVGTFPNSIETVDLVPPALVQQPSIGDYMDLTPLLVDSYQGSLPPLIAPDVRAEALLPSAAVRLTLPSAMNRSVAIIWEDASVSPELALSMVSNLSSHQTSEGEIQAPAENTTTVDEAQRSSSPTTASDQAIEERMPGTQPERTQLESTVESGVPTRIDPNMPSALQPRIQNLVRLDQAIQELLSGIATPESPVTLRIRTVPSHGSLAEVTDMVPSREQTLSPVSQAQSGTTQTRVTQIGVALAECAVDYSEPGQLKALFAVRPDLTACLHEWTHAIRPATSGASPGFLATPTVPNEARSSQQTVAAELLRREVDTILPPRLASQLSVSLRLPTAIGQDERESVVFRGPILQEPVASSVSRMAEATMYALPSSATAPSQAVIDQQTTTMLLDTAALLQSQVIDPPLMGKRPAQTGSESMIAAKRENELTVAPPRSRISSASAMSTDQTSPTSQALRTVGSPGAVNGALLTEHSLERPQGVAAATTVSPTVQLALPATESRPFRMVWESETQLPASIPASVADVPSRAPDDLLGGLSASMPSTASVPAFGEVLRAFAALEEEVTPVLSPQIPAELSDQVTLRVQVQPAPVPVATSGDTSTGIAAAEIPATTFECVLECPSESSATALQGVLPALSDSLGNWLSSYAGPTTTDQRPIAGIQRLTTNAQRPTTSDQRPLADVQGPTFNVSQSTPNAQQPATNAQRPATSDQRPVTDVQGPTFRASQPTTNAQQPATNDQRPATSDQRPVADVQRSAISEAPSSSVTLAVPELAQSGRIADSDMPFRVVARTQVVRAESRALVPGRIEIQQMPQTDDGVEPTEPGIDQPLPAPQSEHGVRAEPQPDGGSAPLNMAEENVSQSPTMGIASIKAETVIPTQSPPVGQISPQSGSAERLRMTLPATESRPFQLTWDDAMQPDTIAPRSMQGSRWHVDVTTNDGNLSTAQSAENPTPAPPSPEAMDISPRITENLQQLADLERQVSSVLTPRLPHASMVALHVQTEAAASLTPVHAKLEYTNPDLMPMIAEVQSDLEHTLRQWAGKYLTRFSADSQVMPQSSPPDTTVPLADFRVDAAPLLVRRPSVSMPEATDFVGILDEGGSPQSDIQQVPITDAEALRQTPTQQASDLEVTLGTEPQGAPMTTRGIPTDRTNHAQSPMPMSEVYQRIRTEMQALRHTPINTVREIEFQLAPERLGKLIVRITDQGNSLSAHFQVESPEARHMLESGLVHLRQELQAGGIQLGELDVSLQDRDRQSQRRWLDDQPRQRQRTNRSVEAAAPVAHVATPYETRALNLLA